MKMFLYSCTGVNEKNHDLKADADFSQDTLRINEILGQIVSGKIGNNDSIVSMLQIARNLAIKQDFTSGYAEIQFQTANQYYRSNKYKEALGVYNQVLEYSLKTGNKLLEARCLERMASVHLYTNDPNLALKLYLQALPLFESVNNKEGIADVYNILGIYKTDQDEFDTAYAYFEKAIALNKEINNDYGLFLNKGNLAHLLEEQGRFGEAESLYLEIINNLTLENDKINLPVILDNYSSFLIKLKRKDESLSYLRKGMSIASECSDTSILGSISNNLGHLYFSEKQFDSAIFYLNKAVVCAKAIDAAREELTALTTLLAIDTISSNYKDAAAKSYRILVLKDSVFARKMRNNLRNSELAYENEKKEKLIAYQHLELKIAKQKKTWFLFLFLISTLSGILLISLIVMFRKNMSKKQEILQERLKIAGLELGKVKSEEEINRLKLEKVQEEVRTKEREQLSNALSIEQKNELLNQISDKISVAMGDADSINAELLLQIVSSIKSQVRSSDEMDQFNEKFSSLHQEFYTNLKNKHPELTKTELKFCAYLKINLSGNQIANILNVTSEAIRKTRYRIRKKMDLSSDESLEHYISTF